MTDVLLTWVAGLAIGKMFAPEPVPGDYITICLLTSMAVGFCTGIAALSNFGAERVVYWREAAMGASRPAYFLGKNCSELLKLLIFLPLAFLCMFYPFTSPPAHFRNLFVILLCTTYACSGCSYLISCFISPKSSQLCVVVFVLLSCMVGGSNPTLHKLNDMGVIAEAACSCSFARYTMEAMYIAYVSELTDVFSDWRSTQYSHIGYNEDNYGFDIAMLIVIGSITRFFAIICLYQVNKGAQT